MERNDLDSGNKRASNTNQTIIKHNFSGGGDINIGKSFNLFLILCTYFYINKIYYLDNNSFGETRNKAISMVYNKKETNDEAEKTNMKVQAVVKKYPTNLEPNVKKFMEWEDQVLEEMWEERGWNSKQTKLKLNFSGDGDIKIGILIV